MCGGRPAARRRSRCRRAAARPRSARSCALDQALQAQVERGHRPRRLGAGAPARPRRSAAPGTAGRRGAARPAAPAARRARRRGAPPASGGRALAARVPGRRGTSAAGPPRGAPRRALRDHRQRQRLAQAQRARPPCRSRPGSPRPRPRCCRRRGRGSGRPRAALAWSSGARAAARRAICRSLPAGRARVDAVARRASCMVSVEPPMRAPPPRYVRSAPRTQRDRVHAGVKPEPAVLVEQRRLDQRRRDPRERHPEPVAARRRRG